jgi:hypothetical protein
MHARPGPARLGSAIGICSASLGHCRRRFVLIQLVGQGILSMAEVQVRGLA